MEVLIKENRKIKTAELDEFIVQSLKTMRDELENSFSRDNLVIRFR